MTTPLMNMIRYVSSSSLFKVGAKAKARYRPAGVRVVHVAVPHVAGEWTQIGVGRRRGGWCRGGRAARLVRFAAARWPRAATADEHRRDAQDHRHGRGARHPWFRRARSRSSGAARRSSPARRHRGRRSEISGRERLAGDVVLMHPDRVEQFGDRHRGSA